MDRLSLLERRVVELLVTGLSGEQAGCLLGIGRREVARCRAAAMRKVGALNGVHLARLVEASRERVAEVEVVVLEDVSAAFG
ncbi:MAG TPA: hypothetical protein VHA07_10145 [Devosia sp.]|nr:hypothetical protein [Devosia sp.]